MKKLLIIFSLIAFVASACSTVQSIVRSTFPYTATLVILASNKAGTVLSATSSASSLDQVFTGDGTNARVQQIRIASAKIESVNPASQSLGVIKSVKLYLSRTDGSDEILVASREDVSAGTGNNLVLDVNSSRFLDEYLQGSGVKIRMEYTLRDQLTVDFSLRSSLGFSSAPAQ